MARIRRFGVNHPAWPCTAPLQPCTDVTRSLLPTLPDDTLAFSYRPTGWDQHGSRETEKALCAMGKKFFEPRDRYRTSWKMVLQAAVITFCVFFNRLLVKVTISTCKSVRVYLCVGFICYISKHIWRSWWAYKPTVWPLPQTVAKAITDK